MESRDKTTERVSTVLIDYGNRKMSESEVREIERRVALETERLEYPSLNRGADRDFSWWEIGSWKSRSFTETTVESIHYVNSLIVNVSAPNSLG